MKKLQIQEGLDKIKQGAIDKEINGGNVVVNQKKEKQKQ